jgi:hypothetical protein
MAEIDEPIYKVSPKSHVSSGKLETVVNCNQCLDLEREMEILHQEISSNNEVIKLLKEDMDSLQRDARMCTSQEDMNMNWLKQNSNKLQKKLNGINKQQQFRNKEGKIIVMDDDHIKGYAPELRSRMGNKFEVMGMVMPGTRLHNIIDLPSQEINLLTRKDTAKVWGRIK